MIGERPSLSQKRQRTDIPSFSNSCGATSAPAPLPASATTRGSGDFSDSRSYVVHVPGMISSSLFFPLPPRKVSRGCKRVNVLNILPVDRSLFETELESVELGRIVRAGDLNSADYVEIVLSPICERRGNDPDVDHIQSALEQSATSSRCSSVPLGRLSRPTAIRPDTFFSARNAAYARAMRRATSGVRSLPAIPRMSYSRKISRESATVTELPVPSRRIYRGGDSRLASLTPPQDSCSEEFRAR
jgi:hypothetical protein